MKQIVIIVFILCICLVSVGCNTNYSESELAGMADRVEQNYSMPNMQGGVSLGLFNTNGEIESEKSFKIDEGESFEKMISVGNIIDNERDYKILLFVDYRQHDFIVNGDVLPEYNFKADKNETVLFPVEIKDLSEGFHDVFFVIVKYPTYKSLDEDFRMSTDMSNLLFIRFNVLVGNNTSPSTYTMASFASTETVFDGVFLSQSNDQLLVWLTQDTNPNTDVDFNTYIGNESYLDKQKFAVITLLDWKQTTFYNGQDVVFVEVDKGNKISIPSSVYLNDEKGVRDLVTILVYNPYEPLDIHNSDIGTGIRVGINVK